MASRTSLTLLLLVASALGAPLSQDELQRARDAVTRIADASFGAVENIAAQQDSFSSNYDNLTPQEQINAIADVNKQAFEGVRQLTHEFRRLSANAPAPALLGGTPSDAAINRQIDSIQGVADSATGLVKDISATYPDRDVPALRTTDGGFVAGQNIFENSGDVQSQIRQIDGVAGSGLGLVKTITDTFGSDGANFDGNTNFDLFANSGNTRAQVRGVENVAESGVDLIKQIQAQFGGSSANLIPRNNNFGNMELFSNLGGANSQVGAVNGVSSSAIDLVKRISEQFGGNTGGFSGFRSNNMNMNLFGAGANPSHFAGVENVAGSGLDLVRQIQQGFGSTN